MGVSREQEERLLILFNFPGVQCLRTAQKHMAACPCAYVDQLALVCVHIRVVECISWNLNGWMTFPRQSPTSVCRLVRQRGVSAPHLTFDRGLRRFFVTSLCVLNLRAHAFQPPVSSHVARVPPDRDDWYVRHFAGHLSVPTPTKAPSLWSKDDWFVRRFLQTAFLHPARPHVTSWTDF